MRAKRFPVALGEGYDQTFTALAEARGLSKTKLGQQLLQDYLDDNRELVEETIKRAKQKSP